MEKNMWKNIITSPRNGWADVADVVGVYSSFPDSSLLVYTVPELYISACSSSSEIIT
jgi:hypothetical protein